MRAAVMAACRAVEHCFKCCSIDCKSQSPTMPVVFTGPLGPITSRAYRLIESFFRCMMRSTAIEIAAWCVLRFASLDDLSF